SWFVGFPFWKDRQVRTEVRMPWRTLAIGLVAGACAHVEAPPGGPEDITPPGVPAITPAPDSIVPAFDAPVVISFDERISEVGIEDAVIVSPRTSPVAVNHGRREIRVSLREGWAPDMIYHVSVRPD